jgi:hypothetical protein
MQQRYYDPAIARFLSVDPVGPLSDPSNHFGRYHYANNNPYAFVDPDGRFGIRPGPQDTPQGRLGRNDAIVAGVRDRLQFEVEGAAAYGIGGRVKHDLVTDRTSLGFVFLGLGAHAKGGAAVGLGADYRVGRLEWGKLDAPVDIEINGAVGPLNLELYFDPGGRLDLNAGFAAAGGAFAGGSVMVDERVLDGSWRQSASGNGGSPQQRGGIEVVNVSGRIDSMRIREQDKKR